ncbi:hypothetical protein EJ02DRAFT_515880 [Clathrospora elynae]|uniref:Uncharacterized protein n=1 Tax=Clathrospora elynae TaxID=706981 RepID=A0A6A5S909_9PLEO|nr:hypothetical protein EJ02DRAFT_515880 [Clathrospora elynae]
MPFLLHPSTERCEEFISRPELGALSKFLSRILLYVARQTGKPGVDNLHAVQAVISSWIKGAHSLRDEEAIAWEHGHGYPVFDDSQKLVDFVMLWDTMEFEGKIDEIGNRIMMTAEEKGLDPFGDVTVHPRDTRKDEMRVLNWEKDGNDAFEVKRNGLTELFSIYGGIFQNELEWKSFEGTLSDNQLDLLHSGVLTIRSFPQGGWDLIRGPCAAIQHVDGGEKQKSSYPCGEHCCGIPLVIRASLSSTPELSRSRTDSFKEFHGDKSCTCANFQPQMTISGATFENLSEWRQFEKTLTEEDFDQLCHGVYRLRNLSGGRIAVVPGLNTEVQLAQADVDITRRDRVTQRNKQPKQQPSPRIPRGSSPGGAGYDYWRQQASGRQISDKTNAGTKTPPSACGPVSRNPLEVSYQRSVEASTFQKQRKTPEYGPQSERSRMYRDQDHFYRALRETGISEVEASEELSKLCENFPTLEIAELSSPLANSSNTSVQTVAPNWPTSQVLIQSVLHPHFQVVNPGANLQELYHVSQDSIQHIQHAGQGLEQRVVVPAPSAEAGQQPEVNLQPQSQTQHVDIQGRLLHDQPYQHNSAQGPIQQVMIEHEEPTQIIILDASGHVVFEQTVTPQIVQVREQAQAPQTIQVYENTQPPQFIHVQGSQPQIIYHRAPLAPQVAAQQATRSRDQAGSSAHSQPQSQPSGGSSSEPRHQRVATSPSSTATDWIWEPVGLLDSRRAHNQAYAEESSEDSPRPSPESWRDV